MATEDFTTFTEVDEDSDITVTASKCDVDTMRRDALSYVRADKGVDHFGDFKHFITVCFTAHAGGDGPQVGFWGLSNGSNTLNQMAANDDGLAMFFYYQASWGARLYIRDYTNDNEDYYTCSLETPYYLTIRRHGGRFFCEIYSDADRTTLLGILSVVCGTGKYRYLYGVVSREQSSWQPAATLTGYCENLSNANIEVLRPSAPGDEENIDSSTSGAGHHHEDVDEAVADGLTTHIYNEDTDVFQRDLYNAEDHSIGSGTINFVTVYIVCIAADQGDNDKVKVCMKSGGVADEGIEEAGWYTWKTYSHQWNTPPEGGSWDWDKIDALQIGVALQSTSAGGGTTVECTQVYVEVDYTPAGWQGKVSGVTNPAKVMGIGKASIAKVKGVA